MYVTGACRDKMLSKPISEVAAEYNPDDRCTPSYVRIPASYPKLKSTGRTALGEEVMNDSWVSIISGSEDYSFKVRHATPRICLLLMALSIRKQGNHIRMLYTMTSFSSVHVPSLSVSAFHP